MFLWAIQNARLIIYVPVCDEMYFNNAHSYLVCRLNENTSEDQFYALFFNLKVSSKEWEEQKELLSLLKGIKFLDDTMHRKRDRTKAQNMTIYKIMTCIPWPWG